MSLVTDVDAVVPPQYNMSTFLGRTQYWAASINPRYLFETTQSIRAAEQLLRSVIAHPELVAFKDGPALSTSISTIDNTNNSDALAKPVTLNEVYHAKTVVSQCVHPTSGDIIPAPFRMACFLPTNYLLVPFMMAPSTLASVPRTLFAQWINQSYNAAVNYANRSSDKQSLAPLLTAYASAVCVACGGSWCVSRWLKRVSAYSTSGMVIRFTAPFATVSTAAMVNLAVMRKHEWMRSSSTDTFGSLTDSAAPSTSPMTALPSTSSSRKQSAPTRADSASITTITTSPDSKRDSSTINTSSSEVSSIERGSSVSSRPINRSAGGVAVMDEDGVIRGHSYLAGWDSVTKCALARVWWNLPCMMLPGVLMMVLPRYCAWARRAPVVCESVLQMAGLTIGVPPALAIYDRVQRVSVESLEPPFRQLLRRDGLPVRHLTYIKGV